MYLCRVARLLEVSPMRVSLTKVAVVASMALLVASCAMPADDPNFNASAAVGAGSEAASEAASQAAAEAATLDLALEAPTSIGVDKPLASTPEKGATIISLSDGTAYDGVFQASLAEAADVLGWTVETVSADMADPAAAATAFDEAVAKKPAGIHISGAFADAVSASIPNAKSANIPVICTGCSTDVIADLADTTIDGTEQNTFWGDALATYVLTSQYEGEDAGVQIFTVPGGAVNDFNTAFEAKVASSCRNCSTSQSVTDPMMVDLTDPASISSFIVGEMTISLGAWAMLDSGALSEGVADTLATDPTLLMPVVVIGRGAAASDIAGLQALAGTAPAATEPSASATAAATEAATEAAATDGATEGAAEMSGRTMEEAQALQAWIAISQPVMAWRVIDQFARIIGGDEPAVGPLPSQLLTTSNASEAVLDDAGNYVGIADYQEQFKTLWGVK